MHIAILGGTGDLGEGLALRWGADTDYSITIGSRDADRAQDAAETYTQTLQDRGYDTTIDAAVNADAAAAAEIAIVAVPPYHVSDTVEAVADAISSETILVSPAVGMQSDEAGLHYHRPGAGSVTAVAADAAPDSVSVIGAFHSLPAHRLADLDVSLSLDTLLLGDDADAKARVRDIATAIDGVRALDAGPLANAAEVESLTPLMINIARYNEDLHDLGVRFT